MGAKGRLSVLVRLAAGAVFVASTVGGLGATTAGAQSPAAIYKAQATLTGPVTTGGPIQEPESSHPLEFAANGYVEQEYFASGTAHAFKATSSPSNGRYKITPTTAAAYRTRILVRRPADPSHFNGTVVVEWMNVSAGESSPDWDYLNPALMRDGYAYVGVSAQALAVNGGKALLGGSGPVSGPITGLVQKDPARYGTLHHPGDQYALDMYAQIGAALRHPSDGVLGPLHPKHVVAVGESQSAAYLTTFADALQPATHVFNGIFIHSRGGGGAPLNGANLVKAGFGSEHLWIRTDLHVPVFMFETQTDMLELGYAVAQQPNTAHIHTWEVAGTSHADAYMVGGAIGLLGCTNPINNGPQHEVAQAAFVAFNKWVDHGVTPPTPARLRLAGGSSPRHLTGAHAVALALDSHGNAIGGVRTPPVDVPASTLSGVAPKGVTVLCSLFGSATPLSTSTMVSLYHSKADYLAKFTADLNKAIAQGYILPADRATFLAQAKAVQFP
jgi:hypothetical protein